jgi:hypothetical protein
MAGPASHACGHRPPVIGATIGAMNAREATWLGGPWDGQSMPLLDDAQSSVTVMDPRRLRDEADVELAEALEVDVEPREPLRVCPVVEQPDGRLVIDWTAGT